MSDIIKTTARLHEAEQPLKQRPLIHIEPPAGAPRASVDSGRDNPFRPGGKIYRSADPIVDFYKQGANQSRPQSPTDSQLLLGAGSGAASAADHSKGAKVDKKRRQPAGQPEGEQRRKPCWRRLLCCCCCCCGWLRCRRRRTSASPEAGQPGPQEPLTHSASIDAEIQRAYNSAPALDPKTKEFKQTKIVVLRDNQSSSESSMLVASQPPPPPPPASKKARSGLPGAEAFQAPATPTTPADTADKAAGRPARSCVIA